MDLNHALWCNSFVCYYDNGHAYETLKYKLCRRILSINKVVVMMKMAKVQSSEYLQY